MGASPCSPKRRAVTKLCSWASGRPVPKLPPGFTTERIGWTARRQASAPSLGLALVILAGSCGGTTSQDATPTTASPSTTVPPRVVAPPPAEQVCQLLSDREVSASLAVGVAGHIPAGSGPRSCTWTEQGDPADVVAQLGLASQRWLRSPPSGGGIGAPCAQGSSLAKTVIGRNDNDALHATCLVDGLAVSLTARTTERSDLIDLLKLVVSRIGSLDRKAFGFSSETEAPDAPTSVPHKPTAPTSTPPKPTAPPECVEAWRADRAAPVHCEEYPETYRAIRDELDGN